MAVKASDWPDQAEDWKRFKYLVCGLVSDEIRQGTQLSWLLSCWPCNVKLDLFPGGRGGVLISPCLVAGGVEEEEAEDQVEEDPEEDLAYLTFAFTVVKYWNYKPHKFVQEMIPK